MNEELNLCFIKYVGTDIDELNTYEFLFTDKVDEFWGENFEYFPSCLCNELIPNSDDYCLVKTIKTDMVLSLVQNSCCFSYQDAIDGIVAIAYYRNTVNILQKTLKMTEFFLDYWCIFYYNIRDDVLFKLIMHYPYDMIIVLLFIFLYIFKYLYLCLKTIYLYIKMILCNNL